MLLFWLGFMTAMWLLAVGGGAYAFWRYAYKPFQAVAKSIKDLHEFVLAEQRARLELEAYTKTEFGLRKSTVLDDETVARAERRLAARAAWAANGG